MTSLNTQSVTGHIEGGFQQLTGQMKDTVLANRTMI